MSPKFGSQTEMLMAITGSTNPSAAPGVIVIHDSLPLGTAQAACETLGEQLWSGGTNRTGSIKQILKTLQYNDPEIPLYWIAPDGEVARAVNLQAGVIEVENGTALPTLCSHTAPFSNDTAQDTSERWQVKVTANNEDLIG